VGFSGDDQNFLAWSGWVRDQLAHYAHRIYLCGLLSLTDAQRSVLQSRGVVPVDLSPIFPADSYPDAGRRHALALEWFFRSLNEGRPYDPQEWPDPPSPTPTPEWMPKPLPPSRPVPREERYFPNEGIG
jgi:hypothetical protein